MMTFALFLTLNHSVLCMYVFTCTVFFNFESDTPFYFIFILRVHVRHLNTRIKHRSILKRVWFNFSAVL